MEDDADSTAIDISQEEGNETYVLGGDVHLPILLGPLNDKFFRQCTVHVETWPKKSKREQCLM